MPKVCIIKTSPETIIEDYRKVMYGAEYEKHLSSERDLIIKLNLSLTKYFPSCSTEPWQIDGVLNCLIENGFLPSKIFPVENKTIVTNPRKGAINNKWLHVFKKYRLNFISLPEIDWEVYHFKKKLFVIDKIFPEGIFIPKMFIGKDILHLPTIKTNSHSIIMGAIKNVFSGLVKEVGHYIYDHEILLDLLIMQRELHPNVFVIMDGTICGDGGGPRTVIPKIKNVILASSDPVAIDAVSFRLMGFSPIDIPYIRMAHEMGFGVADIKDIEIVGDIDILNENWGFKVKKGLSIFFEQFMKKRFLQRLEKFPLCSSFYYQVSNLYYDTLWYSTIGKIRISKFMKTEWGRLLRSYET
ncbi:TPA: iron-sulfur cluster-binding protein [bacterium]|nr:iron-sulfur cluster-binding protein [bacterium]